MKKGEGDGKSVLIWALVFLFFVAAIFGGRGDQALGNFLGLLMLGGWQWESRPFY